MKENVAVKGRLLAGKVALITGGTTGIGRASAELFHAHGAQVLVTGNNLDTLERARAQLPKEIVVLKADARSYSDAEQTARQIEALFGKLDVVFLNAGVARLAPFLAVDQAFYDEHMDTNVKGAFFTLQKVLPLLRAKASVLINTSLAGQKGTPGMSVYGATKAALTSLMRALAVELAPQNIRVNAISPATILTPIQEKFGLDRELLSAVQRDITAKIPLRRFGTADEVARVALFLASDQASYVTGAELPVDGGLLAS